jgi:diguanylate cyclase (GGDEF)-like protein
MLDYLSEIASIATSASPGESDLLRAAARIAAALNADDAYLIKAGDPHFYRLGSDVPPTDYEVKQRGYWMMWRSLASDPGVVAIAAQVEDRIVRDIAPAKTGGSADHLACIVPDDESNSEMLIICRPRAPVRQEEIEFLQVVRPILSQMAGRILDSERQRRHRSQLTALADVARAFNNAHEVETALSDVATALAKASGHDWVTIYVYDESERQVVEIGANMARHSGTETAAMARDGRVSSLVQSDETGTNFGTLIRSGPILLPDVFEAGASLPAGLLNYFARAHITSVCWFPMLSQDRLLGFMTFASSIQRTLDEAEVAFLSDLAAQAATAVMGMNLYRDLQAKKAQLEEASQVEHFLARTDSLTGLPNRRRLEEVLRAERTERCRRLQPLSVVMVDVDHFKIINDTLGHPGGDEALRFVARLARESARVSDFVGRWGGDEFLFVLPDTQCSAAYELAESFRISLRASPFGLPNTRRRQFIEVSAGVAELKPDDEVEEEKVIQWADNALYEAKEHGRNQVRIWLPGVRAA